MIGEVAVLVPVMRRPGNAARFMASLAASTVAGLVRVYAVADAGDVGTVAAWRVAGAVVLAIADPHPGTYARKMNVGYADTAEPWMFLAGDDVRFHPGWLDEALSVAEGSGASVVGTNDLGNAAVMAGRHATHMLVNRVYVDAVGGSWDGPGVLCHEGYRHWYVDNEMVAAARQRGAWAPALSSVVEHLHPLWGKGAADDVYRRGQAFKDADGALFAARARRYGRADAR